MVNFYVRRCEKNGQNFYSVPEKFQADVRKRIEADGYVILDDGTVVPAEVEEIAEVEEESE